MKYLKFGCFVLMLFSINSHAADVGRYQLIKLSEYRADEFLLDTQTGKMWRASCEGNRDGTQCDYVAWAPEDVIGVNATYKQVAEKAALIKKNKSGEASN